MQRHATSKQLRAFGLIVGGMFVAIGVWPILWRGEELRLWACGLAVVLGLPALFSPGLLHPVYRVWMVMGEVLGQINTTIILGVMFYGLFTPIRVVMRLRGKDPMCRRFEPDLETYRVVRQARPSSHMMRQF
jgi:hypothetical protein